MVVKKMFNSPKIIAVVGDYTNEELVELKGIIKDEFKKRKVTPLMEYEIRSRGKCLDCGKPVRRYSKRCFKCAVENRDNSKMNKNLKIMSGVENPIWKGDNVGYFALHSWVRKNKLKPLFCECCNKNKPKDLANISGEYKRDINDFEWLCRKCHYAKDRKNKLDKRDKKGRFVKNNGNW